MIRYEHVNEAGKHLAERIAKELGSVETNAIVFIGALGICVRKLQTLLSDKYTDPAVVCVDTTGKWVIPVVGGHVGGANALAKQIADVIGAQAVITTQSDNTGLWPLDTLARQFGWQSTMLPRNEMNRLIANFVNKKPTSLLLEWNDEGTRHLQETCPQHVQIFNSYSEFSNRKSDFEVTIAVSPYAHRDIQLQYFPPCLHLGFGCQKNVPAELAFSLLAKVEDFGFDSRSVATVSTIELKKDEPMLAELCRQLPLAKRNIYTPNELAQIDVPHPSEKVFEVTGCYGVAEAAALADGGEIIVPKQKVCVNGCNYTFAITLHKSKGHIEIVGAGPGDPELVSVKGQKFISQADLILYAGSLVPKELTRGAKPGAVIRSSADLNLEEQFALMKKFYDDDKLVVRLHTGDPCIYGAIQEQMAFFDQYGMDYHITPGISSFQAAAAELRSQFTIPEECQTIILTRGEGRTPMPEKEKLRLLAQHQSTICIFLSAGIAEQVQNELLAGGFDPETPVAACYKLTWREQRIYRGQLKDLAKILTDNNLKLTTMIVVGKAIDNRSGQSKLYDKHFTHLFRKGDV